MHRYCGTVTLASALAPSLMALLRLAAACLLLPAALALPRIAADVDSPPEPAPADDERRRLQVHTTSRTAVAIGVDGTVVPGEITTSAKKEWYSFPAQVDVSRPVSLPSSCKVSPASPASFTCFTTPHSIFPGSPKCTY